MSLTSSAAASVATVAGAAALLFAASATIAMAQTTFDQSALPDAVKVPVGNKVAMETVGVGEITYECREKKDANGQFEWVFVGPDAALNDRGGKQVGRYVGPPATWESVDGSKVTATQVAVFRLLWPHAPARMQSRPLAITRSRQLIFTHDFVPQTDRTDRGAFHLHARRR